MSKLVAEEYLSSLTDLTVNSKPLINMLTMLADENVDHAPAIVQVIESHLEKVPPDVKLPILYLIDSIIKNVSKVYVPLFTQNIVNVFVSVFEKVDERTRLNMYKLRQTWADVFPAKKLYVLDLRVKDIDHAWPVTAPTPTSIHFNPKFLGNKATSAEATSGTNAPPQTSVPAAPPVTTQSSELSEAILREQLPKKQKILIELQQKKLQLMQTKAIIEGQENQLNETGGQALLSQNTACPSVNEEKAKPFPPKGAGKSKTSIPPSSNTPSSKLGSNLGQNKTKIAPVCSQLIEAVKSRDPRLAKQQQNKNSSQSKTKTHAANSQSNETSKSSKSSKKQRQNKVSEVAHKEQEIYNRQLAMLKTPIAEQVTPVVPAQKVLENLVNVSGKDVDLRLLTVRGGSPTKKRLSTETPVVEEPPKKKNKSEIFDELFGSEDVDLRKMTRGNVTAGDRLPSPPPPPVISNGPTAPQIAAIAPLVVGESNMSAVKEDPSDSPRDDQVTENKSKERVGFESSRGRYRKSWAEIKVKPEAEIKPLTLPTQLGLEIDQRKDTSHSSFDSPEKGGKKHFRDRPSPRGELDRLGRPLLYNKLPNDPRARRESLGGLDGRDTDMRRFGNLIDRDIDTNINVNMIIGQAADQVRNGTMSLQEYNELLKQVIHVNEKQKLREAQNKSRQEIRRSQHHHRNRRSPNRFGSQSRNSPTYRHDDDRRDRRVYNDIDERLQMPWGTIPHNDSTTGFNRLPDLCAPNRSPFDVSEYDDRPVKPEIWEDDKNRFRRGDDFDHSENRPRDVMCNERTHDCVDVPPADPQVLELISKDPMKSINIDGTARDIRFYGDTAVVMLSWDDPKEISFEDGVRRVAIGETSIVCALNDPYIMFMLNGNPHRIRLGAPTRELYIDGEFYEAHFGGPPVQIQIDGLPYLVQLEGPPPQVKIGKRRTDLICGRVNMIVDASEMLPLYLDAKPQRFDLRSRPYVFRLVNCLKRLLVNEVPLDIQFGGGCRQICGYGNLHFLRLSMLPDGVEPGRVQILNMENLGAPSMPNVLDTNMVVDNNPSPGNNVQTTNPPDNLNSIAPNFDVSQRPAARPLGGGPLDILTSLMSGATTPEQSTGFNYQVDNKDKQLLTQSSVVRPEIEPVTSQPPSKVPPVLGTGLNINDLFQRLVASGIVPTLSNATGNNQKPQNESQVKPIDFSDSNSLRERQPPLINLLYSGIQCSSCGVRFSPEETVKYSRHLDWHFRQNRREKDAARKGQSRKWYYDVSDWIQFEEIEDLEERAQSWFETEATSNGDENAEQEEIKSVPAPSGHDFTSCELCRDAFDTYYNEEKEEWHLKPCILVEGKYYHPFCYEDLLVAPEESLVADKTVDSSTGKDDSGVENMEISEDTKEKTESTEECKIEVDNDVSNSESNVSEEFIELKMEESKENTDNVIRGLLNELINCIEFKHQLELDEEKKEENKEVQEEEDQEIEVLESVPAEQKKEIINVDLIEKLDDEDDIVFHRKTPSPIILIPAAKIKQEPVDEMESPVAVVDQTYTNVVSSIDGNVEMIAPQIAPSGASRIKITFNKPITTEQQTEKQVIKVPELLTPEEADPDPLPLKPKKPRIAEREMTVCLPCVRGTEESGLCSIM